MTKPRIFPAMIAAVLAATAGISCRHAELADSFMFFDDYGEDCGRFTLVLNDEIGPVLFREAPRASTLAEFLIRDDLLSCNINKILPRGVGDCNFARMLQDDGSVTCVGTSISDQDAGVAFHHEDFHFDGDIEVTDVYLFVDGVLVFEANYYRNAIPTSLAVRDLCAFEEVEQVHDSGSDQIE